MSLWKVLTARWGTGAGEVDEVSIDASTNSLQTIDYPHHETHGGSHYTFTATDGDLDSAAVMDYILTTPNTTSWVHMLINAYGALHTRLELYENTTHTTNVLQTAYNNNRNSANTPAMTIHTSNDDAADGTLIFEAEWGVDTGGGINRATGGGETRSDAEWVLDQNAKYLVRVESQTDNNVASLILSWYEHTDKN